MAWYRQPLHMVAAAEVDSEQYGSVLPSVEHGDELFLCFFRQEPPGARLARVDDPALLAYEDEPLGPRRERPARSVAHLVEKERHGEAETRCGLARLPATFLERDLLVEDGAFLEVRGELPLVGGMGLGDVDEREVRAIAESLEEALDIARPATKGRSGVAAEDEQQRSVADELSEIGRLEIVGVSHGDGGEGVSRLKRFGVAVAEQARNHRFALRSGGEALDVAAVFRVDDRPGRAVL